MEISGDLMKMDAKARIENYTKGSILQRKGDLYGQTYFVKKGLLRSYIIDSKGKEHIFLFAPEGWIIADIESLEFNEPVKLYIDCLEDSEVIIFDKEKMFNADISKEAILKNIKLLFRRMAILQNRIIMQMSAPAIDRYQHFTETYPKVTQRIPQHMIASYLGITPQALSTLRSKLSKSED